MQMTRKVYGEKCRAFHDTVPPTRRLRHCKIKDFNFHSVRSVIIAKPRTKCNQNNKM